MIESQSTVRPSRRVSPVEVAAWSLAVLVAGVFTAFGGVAVAAVLFFTRLNSRPEARWVLVAVGLLVVVAQHQIIHTTTTGHWVSTPHRG